VKSLQTAGVRIVVRIFERDRSFAVSKYIKEIMFLIFIAFAQMFAIGIIQQQQTELKALERRAMIAEANLASRQCMPDVWLDTEYVRRIHPRVTKSESKWMLHQGTATLLRYKKTN
jgi:hypothetical protein